MTLLLFTASAVLFYSTSKYFPFSIPERLAENKNIRNMVAVLFTGLGIVLMSQRMDVATAIVAASVILMTLIPLLVLSLSAYPKSWIGWCFAIAVIVIIDLLYYAG